MLAPALLVALAACSGNSFSVSSPEVEAARQQAATSMTSVLDALLAPAHPATDGSLDVCMEGQHNWKVDDDFEVRCTYARVVVGSLPGPGLSEAREQLSQLMRDADCSVTSGPTQNADAVHLTCDASGRQVTVTAQTVLAADPDLLDLLPSDIAGDVTTRTKPDIAAAASSAGTHGEEVLVSAWTSTAYYKQ